MTWMRGVFFVPSRPALVFDRSSKRACAHCFKFVGVADISGAFVWLLFLFSLLFLLSFLSSFLSSFLFFLSFFLSFFFCFGGGAGKQQIFYDAVADEHSVPMHVSCDIRGDEKAAEPGGTLQTVCAPDCRGSGWRHGLGHYDANGRCKDVPQHAGAVQRCTGQRRTHAHKLPLCHGHCGCMEGDIHGAGVLWLFQRHYCPCCCGHPCCGHILVCV